MTIKVDIPLASLLGHERHNVVIGEKEVVEALRDVCDENHSGCNIACPVWAANGGEPPGLGGECSCFKDGKEMLLFLREHRS